MIEVDEPTMRAFKRAFLADTAGFSEDGKLMAAYLHSLCNNGVTNPATGSDGHIDPIAQHMAVGRQQVWNRIYTILNATEPKQHKVTTRGRRTAKD